MRNPALCIGLKSGQLSVCSPAGEVVMAGAKGFSNPTELKLHLCSLHVASISSG